VPPTPLGEPDAGDRSTAREPPDGAALVLWRTPAAQGEVRPGVVARLLHQVWRSLAEGVLVLAGAGPERRFFFLRGMPVAVEADDPAEGLIGWLAAAGRLEEEARRAAQRGLAEGLSPAAALIAAGALEPGEPHRAALRAHLRALLVLSVGTRQGAWRFHGGNEFAAHLQPVEVPPLQAILEGARAHLPVKHFADALKAVLHAFPTRTADFDQLVPALGLLGGDRGLALALDGRLTLRQVLEAHKSELKDALSLLWFLSLIGAVVFHETAETGAPPGPAAGPPARPPLPADRSEAIRQAALRILPGSLYQALGVDIAVDAAEADAAWRDVMARFEPGGFAGYEVGDLEDLLRAVQDKVRAAHQVLSSDEKRRQYLSLLLRRAELAGARVPGPVPEAEVAMKRGERALRTRRNAEAVAALSEAVALNPREPTYLAMLAFAQLHDPVLPLPARAAQARARARAALALAPGHLRAQVVLALAEELAGDHAAALRAIDAARHLHPRAELARRVHLRLLRPAPG
jgi:tetratricopeptide (TPR) repeat protein